VVVYFEQLLGNYKISLLFELLFSKVMVKHSFWQKMDWTIFWAIFFTKSSGHPASNTKVDFFSLEAMSRKKEQQKKCVCFAVVVQH
jgi:hypothetical protein